MYVDGFIIPVKADRRAEYVTMAREFAALALKHGATRVVETWGEDVPDGAATSFHKAIQRQDDEVVCFSWIEYPDRETRDLCMAGLMAEPSIEDHMNSGVVGARRLIFGGFEPIIDER